MATEGAKHPRPDFITGGCLCGSVRYTLTFPNNHAWPPMVQTCQCTMCRKFTGVTIPDCIAVHSAQLSAPLSTSPTFTEYQSSPGAYRGFCSKCGSSLSWRSSETPDEVDLCLGSLDERWLVGSRVEGSEVVTKRGTEFKRAGGIGQTLGLPQVHYYWENAIEGVTDTIPSGKKFLTSSKGGESFN